ncbi:MAG: D-aminoacyl-tRNA deacylase [Candidatus Limnocylindrales bacterium]
MRLLLQRAARAEVRVDDAVVGRIGPGLVALVGIGPNDTAATVRQMADKMVDLRIFRDDAGLTNRSLIDVGGDVLAISQFTLYADTRRGRRPSFLGAAAPDVAEALFMSFIADVTQRGVRVARGIFGAEMAVELVNDGPMTIWLDSDAPLDAR